jgi:hypothetical protein
MDHSCSMSLFHPIAAFTECPLWAKFAQSGPQQFRNAECQIPTLLSHVFD